MSPPLRRDEPLPVRWHEVDWPRPGAAALLTVLVRAHEVTAHEARGPAAWRAERAVGPVGARSPWRALRGPQGAPRVVLPVAVSALPDVGRVRAQCGVAALSAAEFGDDDAFAAEVWLRAWVRRHRSVAVRAWLRERYPDRPPEVVVAAAREVPVALALAVVDVAVLVVGLREGWEDEWMLAVQENGFGAREALQLRARPDGWQVLRAMAAFSGGAGGRGPLPG
ncbi:hypothetical protein [Kineococcus rhizosphaerae]|uniref:Uncharacterized protein n=1 Tax=Kineococcus rhizosphaerae TaxID=559628 RepID=A0A2T0RAA9_9ACTN|nr:hypothetical protein [Kineococcus rhizosphaerae]PRY18061.1 hypothetical protein CLV37_101305 [Kineococcus rhizosphaerae]